MNISMLNFCIAVEHAIVDNVEIYLWGFKERCWDVILDDDGFTAMANFSSKLVFDFFAWIFETLGQFIF
jgi:hypothetical protein